MSKTPRAGLFDRAAHRPTPSFLPPTASPKVFAVLVTALLAGCAPGGRAPMSQPEEVMKVAWGPFARQCATTRTSHYVMSGRSGPNDVVTNHESCTGFSATPASGNAIEITASTNPNGPAATVTLSRILRAPSGVSRPAEPGDSGLLAQGSDMPGEARDFAREIGLTEQQIINPEETLSLPIMLYVPTPVKGTLQCRPDGGNVDRGRQTLVFSCTLDEYVTTDRLNARLKLAGVEEVDVLTGVRLSGSLVGSLRGYQRLSADTQGPRADYRIWYNKATEFE